jgi:hypothetical protein
MAEGWFVQGGRSDLLKEFGFQEEHREIVIPASGPSKYGGTGFPKSLKSYRLSMEVFDLSLEEPYYWILDALKDAFEHIDKLEDSFAAAENSAFFGVTQQRLGAQQDKVSQFLAATGKMIKELFQMVRELRIIDERLGYYNGSEKELSKAFQKRGKGAEVTLKGMFVDLVQGGGKSAASVYGMARDLEFVTLPDLFFDAPPFKTTEELETYINGLKEDFNLNVLRVLHRHLHQFTEWKKRTHAEHKTRKRFMLSYLQQHFDIVKMYVNWIKPYLKNVEKLNLKGKSMSSADLISSFEGSMLDIEILARKNEKKMNGCILITFNYRTRPEMKVVQEGYQRGPVHIGRMEINLRVYCWSDQEVENYKKLKEKETIILMGEISSSVQEAMNSLGEELDHYLAEAKGEAKEAVEEKQIEPEKKEMMQKLFGDFYNPKKKEVNAGPSKKDLSKKAADAKGAVFGLTMHSKATGQAIFKNFKKSHRMISW